MTGRRLPRTAAVLLFLFLLCTGTVSADETLRGVFWLDIEQAMFTSLLTDPFNDYPGNENAAAVEDLEEEAVGLLLEEARWVFSGLIYGFRFVYVPQDNASGTAEEFDLTPVALIPRGDPRLHVLNVEYGERREMILTLEYRMSPDQEARYRSWQSSVFPIASGEGGVIFQTEEFPVESLKEAVKQALRDYLRSIIYNKPREVRGLTALKTVPVLSYRSGQCFTQVRIALRVEDITYRQAP
jgi:hypothetical protein